MTPERRKEILRQMLHARNGEELTEVRHSMSAEEIQDREMFLALQRRADTLPRHK